ncbi:MAG: type II toxin-antitoxin system RelE/ParE family toxin [Betaproteobacteria bacterium]|nr:MAG: type II toxin-antitoxin system RelE/ParE family toxin [Betaproteobacteria bacterium]
MIVFAEEAFDDLEQIFNFNYERDPATALAHIEAVRSAVLILEAHPKIGRPAGAGSPLRELVISHGGSGYIALYEHAPAEGLVRVVAIRHQREAGYRGR